MGCIPAKTCRKALSDATVRWPNRNRASDGICGDEAHQARKSDHNAGNAFDLTHDPKQGVDCKILSRQVIKDSRVTYVIFEGEIYRTYKPELGWVRYTGANSHSHHMHVSIKITERDNLSAWPWTGAEIVVRPVLRRGDAGDDVKDLQKRLGIQIDGIFGPKTEIAVKEFQVRHGLNPDGIVGAKTWAALNKEK